MLTRYIFEHSLKSHLDQLSFRVEGKSGHVKARTEGGKLEYPESEDQCAVLLVGPSVVDVGVTREVGWLFAEGAHLAGSLKFVDCGCDDHGKVSEGEEVANVTADDSAPGLDGAETNAHHVEGEEEEEQSVGEEKVGPLSAHLYAVLVTVALTIFPNILVTLSGANIVQIRNSLGGQQARGVVSVFISDVATFLSEGLGLNGTVKGVEPETANDNADCTRDGGHDLE